MEEDEHGGQQLAGAVLQGGDALRAQLHERAQPQHAQLAVVQPQEAVDVFDPLLDEVFRQGNAAKKNNTTWLSSTNK